MPHQPSQAQRPLSQTRLLIDEGCHLPLDLELLARHASFSRYHFIRLFQRAFHQTPHQYLIRRRLARAQVLLRGGELSVTEVCFAVGFQSLGSFSSLFHRATGSPPSAYRARLFRGVALRRLYVPLCYLRQPNRPTAQYSRSAAPPPGL
jgi:AraC-like DNA-binding protein